MQAIVLNNTYLLRGISVDYYQADTASVRIAFEAKKSKREFKFEVQPPSKEGYAARYALSVQIMTRMECSIN